MTIIKTKSRDYETILYLDNLDRIKYLSKRTELATTPAVTTYLVTVEFSNGYSDSLTVTEEEFNRIIELKNQNQ